MLAVKDSRVSLTLAGTTALCALLSPTEILAEPIQIGLVLASDIVDEREDGSGAFRTHCLESHISNDDPLVFPGQPGAAHNHVFFGNPLVHAYTTPAELQHTNTTIVPARLQLHALAYNLAAFLRCIKLPEAMADWSLTSLQLKLIKIGARVVRHARAITFQLAEVAVTGPMVCAILTAIRRLRTPPICA